MGSPLSGLLQVQCVLSGLMGVSGIPEVPIPQAPQFGGSCRGHTCWGPCFKALVYPWLSLVHAPNISRLPEFPPLQGHVSGSWGFPPIQTPPHRMPSISQLRYHHSPHSQSPHPLVPAISMWLQADNAVPDPGTPNLLWRDPTPQHPPLGLCQQPVWGPTQNSAISEPSSAPQAAQSSAPSREISHGSSGAKAVALASGSHSSPRAASFTSIRILFTRFTV